MKAFDTIRFWDNVENEGLELGLNLHSLQRASVCVRMALFARKEVEGSEHGRSKGTSYI